MCTINNDWTHFSVLDVMIHNRTVASQSFWCFLLYSPRGIRPNIQQLKLFHGFRCKSMQQKLQKKVFSSIPWFYRSMQRGDSARFRAATPRSFGDNIPLDSASLHLAVCCRQILIGVKTASSLSAGCLHTIERSPLSCKHVGGSFLLYDICCADAVFTVMCLARYHSHSIVATGLGDRS